MIIRMALLLTLLASSTALPQEAKLFDPKMPEAAQKQDPRPAPDYIGEIFGNAALPRKAMLSVLSKDLGDQGPPAVRGSKEIDRYQRASAAVVLVVTEETLGSGIYLGERTILTNWHVVKSASQVGVAFKPSQAGAKSAQSSIAKTVQASIVSARIIGSDQMRDLALLRVDTVPSVKPLELGFEAELQVGAVINAIGHPTGERWTHSRGIISQVRRNYEWKTASAKHKANVIETQTPINTGDSGGPVIGDSGRVLGIHAFKASGEGLNFAISIGDVKDFLSSPLASSHGPSSSGPSASCKPRLIYEGRSKSNLGLLTQFDLHCRGTIDFSIYVPDNRKDANQALLDSNADGNVDIIVEDIDRDRRWDISFHDVDFDGTVDLVGFHPDGKLTASRFEKHDAKRNYLTR